MQPRQISCEQFMRECAEWARDMKRQRRRDLVQAAMRSVWTLVALAALGLAGTAIYKREQSLEASTAQDLAAVTAARHAARHAARQERQEWQAVEQQQQ
ncbi:hypothetical protein GALL_152320 [mine drainage metagenome]|uniref:Uncharacterized protein n=1 Tax=mine drainage metagenome TaxID=410659 RepID=A0A1J5S3U8_9ZZZZ